MRVVFTFEQPGNSQAWTRLPFFALLTLKSLVEEAGEGGMFLCGLVREISGCEWLAIMGAWAYWGSKYGAIVETKGTGN